MHHSKASAQLKVSNSFLVLVRLCTRLGVSLELKSAQNIYCIRGLYCTVRNASLNEALQQR